MTTPFAQVWSPITGLLDWVGWLKPDSSLFLQYSANRWGIAGTATMPPCWCDLQLGPAQPVMGFLRQGRAGSCLSIRWRGGVMVWADGRWIGDLGPCLGRLVGLLALTRSLDADDRHPLINPSTTSTMGSQALDG